MHLGIMIFVMNIYHVFSHKPKHLMTQLLKPDYVVMKHQIIV